MTLEEFIKLPVGTGVWQADPKEGWSWLWFKVDQKHFLCASGKPNDPATYPIKDLSFRGAALSHTHQLTLVLPPKAWDIAKQFNWDLRNTRVTCQCGEIWTEVSG